MFINIGIVCRSSLCLYTFTTNNLNDGTPRGQNTPRLIWTTFSEKR